MKIEIEENSHADESWNKRLLNSIGTVYQTKEYAAFTNSAFGWNTKFLKFIEPKGEILGQLMISTYPRFGKKDLKRKVLGKLPGTKKMVYWWLCGPVVFKPEYKNDICKALKQFLVSKNVRVSGSEHPFLRNQLSCLQSPFKIKPWGTFLIDLSLDLDTLWKKMDKHSARKNIERARERGVVVKKMKRSDLKEHHKMLRETKRKVGEEVELSTVEKLWDNLEPIGVTGFLARKNEEPISSLVISNFNGYLNEWGVARTEIDNEEKLYSQDLIKWEIIRWGIENKFEYYDLSGVNLHPENKKEQGIFRYKKKFGGELYSYNLVNL